MKKEHYLKQLLNELQMTAKSFAKSLGKERADVIYYILNGRNRISADVAKTIVEKYPKVNYDWLITGEGEMLKLQSDETENSDYRLVPLKNMDAVGGFAVPNVIDTNEAIMGLMPFTDARDGDICIPVKGDSMVPTCPSGSIILIREVKNWDEYFGYGNIFVLVLKNGRRILKEVAKHDENPNEYITCISHNKEVAPEPLPKSLIDGVWKVIKILIDKGF